MSSLLDCFKTKDEKTLETELVCLDCFKGTKRLTLESEMKLWMAEQREISLQMRWESDQPRARGFQSQLTTQSLPKVRAGRPLPPIPERREQTVYQTHHQAISQQIEAKTTSYREETSNLRKSDVEKKEARKPGVQIFRNQAAAAGPHHIVAAEVHKAPTMDILPGTLKPRKVKIPRKVPQPVRPVREPVKIPRDENISSRRVKEGRSKDVRVVYLHKSDTYSTTEADTQLVLLPPPPGYGSSKSQ